MRRLLSTFYRPGFCQGLVAALLFLGCAYGAIWSVAPSLAQGLPPAVQDMLNQRGPSGIAAGPSTPFAAPRDTTDSGTVLLQPSPLATRPQPRSMVEQILSARAGMPLHQFGYNELGAGRSVLLPQSGGVQDNYILGPGDEVVITLRGQEAGDYRTFVDRNGLVIVPKLKPINVAGRTLADFRMDLVAAVQRAYVATESFVSLGTVRQIRVTVGGEVNNPGLRVMTGLASVMDAIQISSGVKKTGSLRNVVIQRGASRIRVDLYSLLRATGGAQPPMLTDGDRVIVSPLGPVVAIAGSVRMPAIYELAPGQSGMTAASLITMAGGYTIRGRYDLALIGISADGRTQLLDISSDRALVRDSDVLIVRPTGEQMVGRATFESGTTKGISGTYTSQATRLSDMLRAPGLMGDDPYPLFAIISRRDPVSLLRTLVAVTPSAVRAGRQDFSLLSDDIVHAFTRTEATDLIRAINWFDNRRNRLDEKVQNSGETPLLGKSEDELPVDQNARKDIPDGRAFGGAIAGTTSPDFGRNVDVGSFSSDRTGINPDVSACNIKDTVSRDTNVYDDGGSGANALLAADGGKQDAREGAGTVGDVAAVSDMTAAGRADGTQIMGASSARDQLRAVRPDPATVRYCREISRVQRLADALKVEPGVVANFLLDHLVTVDGAVRGPGKYFVGPDLPLATLVQAVGGTLNQSDRTGVERVSTVVDAGTGQARTATETLDLSQAQFATVVVRPHDHYRFPQAAVQTVGTVTLKGEVRRPGVYSIVRGERLSDLLVRAGGLTSVAYPYGAVFLRKSVAERERAGFLQAARDLERQLTVSMTRTPLGTAQAVSPINYQSIRGLVSDLRSQEALGRVSVNADPAVLATRPQSDLLVEAGDVLYIPQRPSSVTVIGEVLNPASIPVTPGTSIAEYIDQAGGYARFADDSRTFLVLPDGTARQVEKSWFRLGSESIPPGSIIVVPKDVDPFDFRAILIQGTQVFSQLAISAASLSILSQSNNSNNNNLIGPGETVTTTTSRTQN